MPRGTARTMVLEITPPFGLDALRRRVAGHELAFEVDDLAVVVSQVHVREAAAHGSSVEAAPCIAGSQRCGR